MKCNEISDKVDYFESLTLPESADFKNFISFFVLCSFSVTLLLYSHVNQSNSYNTRVRNHRVFICKAGLTLVICYPVTTIGSTVLALTSAELDIS
jgi:hypothetical protein